MPRRLLLLVLVLAWVASACQVKVAAGIDIARDGTGRVTAGLGLDADAVKEIGDLATGLRLDDVRRAGWQVDGPRKEGDDLTWVRASKSFADAGQVPAIMAELNGPDGPFRGFRVVRSKSLLRSRTTFTGTLDLSQGLAGLADPELTAALGDVSLGLDPDGLKARFGDRLAATVDVRASAGLPGKPTTKAPATRDGRRVVWSAQPGQVVPLEASSQALRLDPALVAAAGASLLTAVMLLVVLTRRRRRR